MRKSILRFGALALMSLMSIGVFAQNTFQALGNAGEYRILQGGTTVSLVKANALAQSIPEEVSTSQGNKYKVTAIEAFAFTIAYTDPIFPSGTVTIPNTVTTVVENSFKGVSKLSINLSNLTSISANAFKDVIFDDASKGSTAPVTLNTTPGNSAFEGSNLVAVKWNGGAEIPSGCFKNCVHLTTFQFAQVDLTGSVYTTIGESAFDGCKLLNNFGWQVKSSDPYYLPAGLSTIGDRAFYGCEKLTGLMYADATTPVLSTVGVLAFANCKDLTDTDFNIFRKAIEFCSGAFMGCSGLTSITIPAGVTTFQDQAVKVGDTDKYYGVFEDCYKEAVGEVGDNDYKPATGLTSVTFNTSFSALGQNAFKGCALLSTLTSTGTNPSFAKTDITSIPEGAFSGCIALTSIAFPKVTTIGKEAFMQSGLTSFDLPAELTTISESAFAGITGLLAVTFPAKVETIGKKAFNGCTTLATVTITGQNADPTRFMNGLAAYVKCETDDVFDGCASPRTLNVPYGCYATYKNDEDVPGSSPVTKKNPSWHKFTITPAEGQYDVNDIFYVGGLGYKVISKADVNNDYLATVAVVDGLYKAGTEATVTSANATKINETNKLWKEQTPLSTSITIPQYVCTEYDKSMNVFYKVTTLTGVNDVVLTNTDDYTKAVKANIAKVEAVAIQAAGIDVPAIFNAASGFSGLKAFNTAQQENVGTVGSISSLATSAFEGCTKLSSVVINGTLTAIPEKAFKSCASLTAFEIPATVTSIGDKAFMNPDEGTPLKPVYKGLATVTLPSGLTSIGAKAFYGTALTEVTLPSSVRKIGANAFSYTYSDNKDNGVKNVYANWVATDFTALNFTNSGEDNYINPAAFGTAQSTVSGPTETYHLRNLHYPAGTGDSYATADMFKTSDHLFQGVEGILINGKNQFLTPATAGGNGFPSITLYDKINGEGVESVVIKNNIMANVEYKRTFIPNVWQCWFVPFDVMPITVEGATFAKIWDTQLDENEQVSIEIKTVGARETVKANTCYLVKFNDDVEQTINATTPMLYATPVDQAKSFNISNAVTTYTFTGLYKTDQATASHPFYIVNENGNLQNQEVSEANEPDVYAYRFIMTTADNETKPYVKFVVLDDEDVTAIENVKSGSLTAPMFDLQGRQIAAPAKGQVYIQNGVKKLAK